jgi:copper chaperone CopZ
MKKEAFDISGMTCSACSGRVQTAVAKLAGVLDVTVNLLKNDMAVSFDEAALSAGDIVMAVEKAGYGAALRGKAVKEPAGPDLVGAEARAMKTRLTVSIISTLPLFLYFNGTHACFAFTRFSQRRFQCRELCLYPTAVKFAGCFRQL